MMIYEYNIESGESDAHSCHSSTTEMQCALGPLTGRGEKRRAVGSKWHGQRLTRIKRRRDRLTAELTRTSAGGGLRQLKAVQIRVRCASAWPEGRQSTSAQYPPTINIMHVLTIPLNITSFRSSCNHRQGKARCDLVSLGWDKWVNQSFNYSNRSSANCSMRQVTNRN